MAPEYLHPKLRVVTIGGGTGQFGTIIGLRDGKVDPQNMVALFTVTDSGGSAGSLVRDSQGQILPPGDARRCLLAFAERERREELTRLFNYRGGNKIPILQGHNLMNLFLAASEDIYGNLEDGLSAIQKYVFNIPGTILPSSLNKNIQLVATYRKRDGSIEKVFSEEKIDLRFKSASYHPKDRIIDLTTRPIANANPRAIQAIEEADLIVLTPGDVYTSVAPHLLMKGIPEAMERSNAKVVFCGNIMTKPGETDSYKASDCLKAITRYLNPEAIYGVILNHNTLSQSAIEFYAQYGQEPMVADLDTCQEVLRHLPLERMVATNLAHHTEYKVTLASGEVVTRHLLRHDENLLADEILKMAA